MDTANFFYTYAGMYITQSFLHALIATILVDMAIQAWKIDNPLARQRFRFTIILYAIASFPLYQIFDPNRSTVFFRADALFNSDRWLSTELFGVVPLRWAFLALLSVSALVFLFQELLPVLRHLFEAKVEDLDEGTPEDHALVEELVIGLPGPKPKVVVLEDDDLVLFSSSGKKGAVFMSNGLLHTLTREQARAALAHEVAHMTRNRRPLLVVMFVLRVLMFFNPVVLLEFRRAVRNEEKICDDIAVSQTQDPQALADALKLFFTQDEGDRPDGTAKPSPVLVSLEEYGHNLQLEGRITRLEQALYRDPDRAWFPFLLVFSAAAMINYYVV